VTRRITYFVASADQVDGRWIVRGEVGLGPLHIGDQFSFVSHDDRDDDSVSLAVDQVDDGKIGLTGSCEAGLQQGDILGGEVDR
jgi:hypothetical protein